MSKVKRNISLSQLDWKRVEMLKASQGFTSLGETIAHMIEHYERTATNASQARLTAEIVRDVLEPVHQSIVVKQNAATKHISILLDMFNDYIIDAGGDIPKDAMIKSIDRIPSNLYLAALQAYQEKAKHASEKRKNRTINRGVDDG